jgi:protease IV
MSNITVLVLVLMVFIYLEKLLKTDTSLLMYTIFTIIFTILGFLPLHFVRFLHRKTVCSRRSVWIELDSSNVANFQQGSDEWLSLQEMAEDEDLRTLVLSIHSLPVGWANIQAYRELLETIKASGKTIFVHLFTPDMRGLYIASVGDKVWIQPSGEIFWTGLGGRHTFYGALFERLGIKADIEAAGDYKSFGEPYTRSSSSEANREQLLSLYGDIQNQYLEDMSISTGISLDILTELSSQSPLSPEKLEEVGLIDGTLYRDQLVDKVKEFTLAQSKSLPFDNYHKLCKWERFWKKWGDIRPKIAVIYLSGTIVENTEKRSGIEAGEAVDTLKQFAEDDRIKAIVLSVNSPGGSATASDRIAREVRNLKHIKPVVVHFGNVAASGGYYLSAHADEIIAQKGTITGSIGVVGGKLVVGNAFERHGIHGEIIAVGADTDMFDVWTPFTESQRQRFKAFLSRTYTRFLLIVSEGRTIPEEAVDSVAQGRVWSGKQALENGLVDRLGNLNFAIKRAATRAGLDPKFIRVINWRKKVPFHKAVQQKLLSRQQSMSEMVFNDAPELIQQVYDNPLEPLMLLPMEVEY